MTSARFAAPNGAVEVSGSGVGKSAAERYGLLRPGFVFLGMLLFAVCLSVRGEKLAEFREPFKYPAFAIGEDRIYVWDSECVVHMYAKKDFAHLGTFGRKGQGPAEFEFISYIHVLSDRLCIGQGQKVSYFSKDGKYLASVTNPNATTGAYMPLGQNFVGTQYLPSDPTAPMITLVVSLFGPKFNEMKRIYQTEIHKVQTYNADKGKQDILFVGDCCKYEVFEEKLYVGDSTRGFFFSVFGSQGERLNDISRSFQKKKITSVDTRRMMAQFREAVGDQAFNLAKARVNQYIFPDFYPAYEDFSVDDGKIYVFSYPIPDRPTMVTILDMRGNLLREVNVPSSGLHRAAGSQSYCAYKGNLYHLIYNDASGLWELHTEKLG